MSTSDLLVQVEGLGKRYRLGVTDHRQLADEVKALTARILGRPDPTIPLGRQADQQRIGQHFWVLRDINFDVRHGEVLGVVGRNGAGKSTLLKLLSRITLPTEGTIRMRGKVSSLLEVGTGFHPELTGRENIFLNGSILGMRKAEVSAKLDEIVAFSGITHHLDTPVKRYSSGMRVRLGFAIAAHLEPEVLIVDEVLSVGDAEFQRKSMGKMKSSAVSGRTVLFVSHNMTAVRALCSRVLWLENGRVRMLGPTEEVVNAYLGQYSHGTSEVTWGEHNAPGNEEIQLRRVRVSPGAGGDVFNWGDEVLVEVELRNQGASPLDVSIDVVNSDDQVILTTHALEALPQRVIGKGRHLLACRFPAHLFNADDLRLTLTVWRMDRQQFQVENAVSFTITEPPRTSAWHGRRKGVVRMNIPWEVKA